jgi:hypothetical protein
MIVSTVSWIKNVSCEERVRRPAPVVVVGAFEVVVVAAVVVDAVEVVVWSWPTGGQLDARTNRHLGLGP